MKIIQGKRVKASIPLVGMRRAIANHMVKSLSESAQMTIAGEIEMTGFMALRQEFLQKESELGIRVTYTDMLVLALVKAIEQEPLVNSSIIDNEINIWEDINIGIAVAVDRGESNSGLVVPVVKNAENKSLLEISQNVRKLTSKAREGKLQPDDVDLGTITISNVGNLVPGWAIFTPIINQPQVVIVQPGGIFDTPVVIDGEIVIRPIMTYSITWDHRVLDGAPVIAFLTHIKDLLESPEWMEL